MTGLPTRVIDSHVHVWDLAAPWMTWLEDRPATWDVVRRDFAWKDLRGQLDDAGVAELILVQASPDREETRLYLEIAEREPSVLGVVGWVSLMSASRTQADLEWLAAKGSNKLVGIRNNHGWAPDGNVLATPGVVDSCKIIAEHNLVLDLHFKDYTELPLALDIVERIPDLVMVIDHMGKPLIQDPAALAPWREMLSRLSQHPNVFMKYSGWATFLGRAQASDVRGYVEAALEKLGPGRMMFGSNWPVALVADSYEATYHATRDALPDLAPAEVDKIFYGTAARCYLGS